MKKRLFTLALFTYAASCSTSPTLNQQLEVFIGTTIACDMQLTRVRSGIDSEDYSLGGDSIAKLIIYIDSVECSACHISTLSRYNDIYYRAIQGKDYIPIMIFSPATKNISDIERYLMYSSFDHTVYIDKNHLFSINNSHIPKDPKLHTFLLDPKNKVVLVGNPINNPTLWNLYVKTIEGL